MINQYTINHRHLFMLGWAYYLMMPLFMGIIGVYDADENFSMMAQYFQINSQYIIYLGLFSSIAPVFYLTGSFWSKIRAPKLLEEHINERKNGSPLYFVIYLTLVIFFAIRAQALLGGGYMGDADPQSLGPMATLQMLILFQFLYERSAGYKYAKAIGILLVVNSILLLSAGGRLYVISSITSIYFHWWNWNAYSRKSQLRSLILILIFPIILALIGMWRLGGDDISKIGFYLTAEALFTNISAMTLITNGRWSLFPTELPLEFISSFVNLLPSLIWPDKSEWLSDIASINKSFDNPFGAVSIVASSITNFGFIGGLILFTVVGAYLTLIGRSQKNAAQIAHYCYLVGLLPFMFFRDPFQIQVKVVFTGLILYWITVFGPSGNTISRVIK